MRRLLILIGLLAAVAAAALVLRGSAGRPWASGGGPPAPDAGDGPSPERCAAETLDGERCTRSAEPGSRFCWQHG